MTQRILSTIIALLIISCTTIYAAVDQEGIALSVQAAEFSSKKFATQPVISGQTTTIALPGTSGPINSTVSVVAGDIIQITATGTIQNSGNAPSTTPDGVQFRNPSFGPSLLPNISASSLIGSISNSFTGINLLDDNSDTNPKGITGTSIGQPGIYGPGYIGSSFSSIAASSGEIYIAYNDNFLDDNTGSFTVNITIVPKQALQYKCYLPSILK